jgi:tetratricopeptide (TPR) repeat protein
MQHQKTCYRAILFLIFMFCLPAGAYPDQAVLSYNEGNAILGNISLLKPNVSEEYRALSAYNHSIELAPEYYEAWNGKADVLNRLGYYSDALEASNRSLGINNTYVPAWINRGTILYMLGYQSEEQGKGQATADFFYHEQIAAFEKATALDPGNAVAWFNRGFALAGVNRYDEALTAFEKVRSLDPAYPHLDYYVQLAQKNRDAATPFYVKYAPWAIGGFVLAAGAGAVLWMRKKTPAEPEPEINRRARRRKEK